MYTSSRYSLSRQFFGLSLVILIVGMFVIGYWTSRQIEKGVLNRTAAITALYVDSILTPHLQSLAREDALSGEEIEALDSLLLGNKLSQQIVSFKIWSLDGTILYNPSRELIGRKYPVDGHLMEAMNGVVTSSLSELSSPENEFERQFWDRLIETYAPVREAGSDRIIAISEFYQLPDDLETEVGRAQVAGWSIVATATLIMYLLLTELVNRGSNIILEQQQSLKEQLRHVQDLLSENQDLNRKLRRAAGRAASLNEKFLRRISADLHDGPVQDLALAYMQIEPLEQACIKLRERLPEGDRMREHLQIISNGLTSAMDELRKISSGLRLPELEHLSIREVAGRVVRDFERKTSVQPALHFLEPLPKETSLESKITLYRVVNEALSNGLAHGGTHAMTVKIWQAGSGLCTLVEDKGRGFDLAKAEQEGRLGLAGMRERVEVLGGYFSIETLPGKGTKVYVEIPIESDSNQKDVDNDPADTHPDH